MVLRLELDGIAFVAHREVAQAAQVGVTEQGVVVDGELGIERHQPAVVGQRQRVDLEQAGIERDERGGQLAEQMRGS